MSPKDELLNRAAQEYKAFYQALDGLNEADLTEVWLGAWSIKEIVAHMVGWHRELTPALERIARGELCRRRGLERAVRGRAARPAGRGCPPRLRQVARGVPARGGRRPGRAFPARADGVQARRPQQCAPLPGARGTDPRVAGLARALTVGPLANIGPRERRRRLLAGLAALLVAGGGLAVLIAF